MPPFTAANYGDDYQVTGTNAYYFFVAYNNNEFYDSVRHYYIQRHDKKTIADWLIHDTIDNNLLDLGSWYRIFGKIVCYKK